jgi:hypothetical protein
MVHAFASVCFALIAMGAGFVIWAMLFENRAAIASALGMTSALPTRAAAGRRIRVRSVQPVTVRAAAIRRAA